MAIGRLDGGLADEHLLEAALERGVLLDVLAELVQRGRTDHAQLAAGQHGLEHVPGVHRALAGRAGPDHGVHLVDEGDDLAVGVLDLGEHRLEPLLEVAAVLGARDHRAHVERDDPLVAQRLGDVAGDDALGETLHDRGLADAGLADQHRVVLGPTRQHLDDPTDLVVAADDRIELARTCGLGEVASVLLERLEGVLGVLARHAAGAAHLGERREHLLAADLTEPALAERLRLVQGRDRQQEQLARQVLVTEVGALRVGGLDQLDELLAGRGSRCRRPSAARRPQRRRHRGW